MEIRSSRTRIAVTGSTGHLGSVLIPMLLEQDFNLKCLYRSKRPSPDSWRELALWCIAQA